MISKAPHVYSLAGLAAVTVLVGWGGPAHAQWVPGPRFEEPTVVVGDPAQAVQAVELGSVTVDPAERSTAPEAGVAAPEDLAPPLDQDAVQAIHAQAAAAVVPVRAIFERDPLLWPPEQVLDGAATAVSIDGRAPIYLTSLSLVDGATRVEMDWEGRQVRATVHSDARYGLAVLEPAEALEDLQALPVHPVNADEPVEAFSAGPNTSGSTLGAAGGVYAWYQLNTVGVTMGYPLVNRRGELVGIGSHRYPLEPQLSLSVPSGVVQDFLAALAAPE